MAYGGQLTVTTAPQQGCEIKVLVTEIINMISVLIADDHTILRQGLVSLLSNDPDIRYLQKRQMVYLPYKKRIKANGDC